MFSVHRVLLSARCPYFLDLLAVNKEHRLHGTDRPLHAAAADAELSTSARALSSRHEINRQIRLCVVREFNFPDEVTELLENSNCYCLDVGDGSTPK